MLLTWSFSAREREWVESAQDGHNEQDLGHAQELSELHLPSWRREVVSFDGELRVFLLQYSGILLKYLPVPSGITTKRK